MTSGAGGAAGLYANGVKSAASCFLGSSWIDCACAGEDVGMEAVRELRVCPLWYAGSVIATFSSC